jgi:hypothetical protein
MSAKIQIFNHDFKLRSCLDYAHRSWNLHRSPKTAELKPIADFFKGRCARLRALMQLPAQVGNVTIKMRDTYIRSVFEVTGGFETDKLTAAQVKEIEIRSKAIFTRMTDEAKHLKQRPDWDELAHKHLIDGLAGVEVMGGDPPSFGAMHASMMSYLTTGWTIIETMSGDLWESALNIHPESLANLTGAPKRLKGGQINQTGSASKESKSVRLDEISKHEFKIANKMGTILRGRFEFSSLDGIREAYASAFDKGSAEIDRAITDKSLDALSTFRNVIVHRDAVADSEYIKKAKFLTALPPAPRVGHHLLLDGDIVVRLLKPAIAAANQLFIAVDSWLAKSLRQD